MTNETIMEILQSLKKDYFKDVPEDVADSMISKLVNVLLTR